MISAPTEQKVMDNLQEPTIELGDMWLQYDVGLYHTFWIMV